MLLFMMHSPDPPDLGIRNIVVLAAVSLLLAILQVEMGWAWTGRAVGVADGDTITVLRDRRDQVKIRLYGIDVSNGIEK